LPNQSSQKIALFVDVQNIYYTTRQIFGQHFNYRALWTHLSAQGEIVHAFAYAIDRGDAKQQQFQQILRDIGFEVKLKPYIQRRDGSAKGDWDVGIALDVMEWAGSVDKVVLLSGDGDFDLLLQRVQKLYAVACDVYGVADLTARSLTDVADNFYAIEQSLLLPA
jgi:uncharacterized LabA/DUF88 family protein